MGKIHKCGKCNGTGKVWIKPFFKGDPQIQKPCRKCGGKGVK